MLVAVVVAYSYLFGNNISLLILEVLFSIPIVLYVYKKDVNHIIMSIIIFALIFHTIIFGYFSAFVFFGIYLLPAIIIGRFLRTNKRISHTLFLVTLVSFISIIIMIFTYDQLSQTDIVKDFFTAMEQQLLVEDDMLRSMVEGQVSMSYEEYIGEMTRIAHNFHLSILFIFSLINVFIKIVASKLIMNLLSWKAFNIKNIIMYTPPRSMVAIFFISLLLIGVNQDPNFLMTFENLTFILVFIIYCSGFAFKLFLIKKVKGTGKKLLISIITFIALGFMPYYFVSVGIMDILLRLKYKLSISKI